MTRPDWDSYFMKIAEEVKARSTCLSPAKGAVIVSPDFDIISTGYNATPSKTKHCDEGGCQRCYERLIGKIKSGEALERCVCVHGEENAIVRAARRGSTATKGATIYTTFVPCSTCARMIINAGIMRVVAKEPYPEDLGVALMKEAGVILDRYGSEKV